LTGVVTSGTGPVANADVLVIDSNTSHGPGSVDDALDHFRPASTGFSRGPLPAGPYPGRANKDGRAFGTPDPASVTITAAATTTQNFSLPGAGRLRVTVKDESNLPIPAKVQLVGFDPSPNPINNHLILGLINVRAGEF